MCTSNCSHAKQSSHIDSEKVSQELENAVNQVAQSGRQVHDCAEGPFEYKGSDQKYYRIPEEEFLELKEAVKTWNEKSEALHKAIREYGKVK